MRAYNERGNDVEDRFYDTLGHLVLSDGRAISRSVFDIRGNKTEVSYFDPNEHLVRRLTGHPPNPTYSAEFKRRFGVARAV
jgi:hypothetical protein